MSSSQSLTFPNADGHQLAARLDLPVDRRPIACAIFAHCFTCTKNLKAVGAISRALTREGIAVLRFDFTGLGESEGAFEDTTFSSNVSDLLAAAAYLETHYEAPSVLVGHSLGGAAVLQAACKLDAVQAVATIGAPFDPQHVEGLLADDLDEIAQEGEACVTIGGRPFRVKQAFLDDLRSQQAKDNLSALRKPVLLFHSPVDAVVGIDNARLLFDLLKHPKSFVSLDQADHLLSEAADAQYVGRVLAAWARKYIGTPKEQRVEATPAQLEVVARIGREKYRTEIEAGGFPLVADEPASLGGTNLGPTPYNLLLAGLGACTAMTLRMYADRKEWPLEGIKASFRHEKVHAKDCADCESKEGRIDRVYYILELEGDLSDEQERRLRDIAKRCPVHQTLKGEVVILPEPEATAVEQPT